LRRLSGLPGVVHVLARSSGSAQGVWEAAAGLPCAVLVSSCPQEAHDFALLAHKLAAAHSMPCLHIVDAAALQTVESARVRAYDALAREAPPPAPRRPLSAPAPSGNGQPSPGAPLEAAAAVAALAAQGLASVVYAGHPQATHVLVAAAGGGALVEAALRGLGMAAGGGGARVGVVKVALAHPWPAAAIAQALPATAKQAYLFQGGGAQATGLPAFPTPQGLSEHFVAEDANRVLEALAGLCGGAGAAAGAPPPSSGAAAAAAVAAAAAAAPGPPSNAPRAPCTLSLWSLGGSAQDWPLRNTSPSALLPLLSATAGISASAAGSGYTGRAIEGACSVGFTAFTRIGAPAAPAAPAAARSCVVLTHPALLAHYSALGSLAPGTDVLICLPPLLPKEDPAPPTARLHKLLSLHASQEDLRALSQATLHVFPLEEAANGVVSPTLSAPGAAGGLTPTDALAANTHAKAFLLRAAALYVHLGGSPCLPALSPLLLSTAQVEFRDALGRPSPDAHDLLLLLQALEQGLVRVPHDALPTTTTTTSGGSGSLPRPPLPLPRSTPPTKGRKDHRQHLPSRPSTWSGVGPHKWATAAAAVPPPHPAAAAAASAASAAAAKTPRDALALSLAFPAVFSSVRAARPLTASPGETFEATVSKFVRLTPEKYDRNIFHIEFDTTGTGLTYEIGSALGVHPRNDAGRVCAFLSAYGVPWDTVVALEAPSGGGGGEGAGGGRLVCTTAFRTLAQDFDIFGRVGKEFYEALAHFAGCPKEAAALAALGGSGEAGDDVGFTARETEAYSPEDVLREFPSARPPFHTLLTLLPRIKPRHYSIASSMRAHPTSVHLLVVEVAWSTPKGRAAHGLASHYLAGLREGDPITISVLHSEMHLPKDPLAPIFMAGLGTGMAPFRAFIQERVTLAKEGKAVGPMTLYFGARHRAQEYLYGEELEAVGALGLLRLRLAFSRDTSKKVYIQHLMQEDGAMLWGELQGSAVGGSFYLCGPTWPEADVEQAISSAFEAHGGLTKDLAAARIKDMKAAKRYVLEVY
jgi:sulfite reductase alpha subunit-like flavoprotein